MQNTYLRPIYRAQILCYITTGRKIVGSVGLMVMNNYVNNKIMKYAWLICIIGMCLLGCKTEKAEWTTPEWLELRTGDLVFRKGESLESHVVMGADKKSEYSHVGIVIWNEGEWKVLHAVPNERVRDEDSDSVKMESIGVFFRSDRASGGAIMRPKMEDRDTDMVKKECMEIWERRPLFDGAFKTEDTTAYYCTELAYHVYKDALEVDLSQGQRHKFPMFEPLILCSDIYTSPLLEEVYSFMEH